MAVSGRRSIALLAAFECLLLLIVFAASLPHDGAAQDRPLALTVVLTAVLGTGDALGLFVALLAYAATVWRQQRRSTRRREDEPIARTAPPR